MNRRELLKVLGIAPVVGAVPAAVAKSLEFSGAPADGIVNTPDSLDVIIRETMNGNHELVLKHNALLSLIKERRDDMVRAERDDSRSGRREAIKQFDEALKKRWGV